MLAAHGIAAGSVRPLGAGLDHAAFDVDGELVVRLVLADADRARVVREARLLSVVAAAVPLRVPQPVLVDGERGCLAYRRLPGSPVLGLDGVAHHAPDLGATLGRFLCALHALPVDGGLVEPDDTPLTEWLAESRGLYPRVRPYVPGRHREVVGAFLAAQPPPAGEVPVLAHNDLGIEHLLVDPATWALTGVVDWSDAAVTDRGRDLGLILRDLGPTGLDAALTCYGPVTDADLERAVFHARCGALEDLAHGLDAGAAAYVAKAVTSLDWLFPGARAATTP